MKRTGFFARIAQAAAVPVALAVGRAAPMGAAVGMSTAKLGSFEGGIAEVIPEFTDGYLLRYADGATSLMRIGSVTPGVLRDAATIPRVVSVIEHSWENGRWLPISEHMPLWGP